VIGNPCSSAPSSASSAIRTREAPIEPQGIGQWLTVREVACLLRVTPATVYRLIDRGELRHARISNAIRVSPSDLATFLRGHGQPTRAHWLIRPATMDLRTGVRVVHGDGD
jgi:excisionase family DNA binding protein